jgi:hypothetical protein
MLKSTAARLTLMCVCVWCSVGYSVRQLPSNLAGTVRCYICGFVQQRFRRNPMGKESEIVKDVVDVLAKNGDLCSSRPSASSAAAPVVVKRKAGLPKSKKRKRAVSEAVVANDRDYSGSEVLAVIAQLKSLKRGDDVIGIARLRVRRCEQLLVGALTLCRLAVLQAACRQPVVDTWVSDEIRVINPYAVDGFQCEICR